MNQYQFITSPAARRPDAEAARARHEPLMSADKSFTRAAFSACCLWCSMADKMRGPSNGDIRQTEEVTPRCVMLPAFAMPDDESSPALIRLSTLGGQITSVCNPSSLRLRARTMLLMRVACSEPGRLIAVCDRFTVTLLAADISAKQAAGASMASSFPSLRRMARGDMSERPSDADASSARRWYWQAVADDINIIRQNFRREGECGNHQAFRSQSSK